MCFDVNKMDHVKMLRSIDKEINECILRLEAVWGDDSVDQCIEHNVCGHTENGIPIVFTDIAKPSIAASGAVVRCSVVYSCGKRVKMTVLLPESDSSWDIAVVGEFLRKHLKAIMQAGWKDGAMPDGCVDPCNLEVEHVFRVTGLPASRELVVVEWENGSEESE